MFLNSASVSNTCFLREYALQEFLVWLFVFNSVIFYQATTRVRFGFLMYYGFSTALLLLSGYFSLLFVVIGVLTLIVCKWRQLYTMLSLAIMIVSAFIWSRILYKSYFTGLLDSGHAKEAQGKLDNSIVFENLKKSLSALWDILQLHYCNVYILLAFGLGFGCAYLWRKKYLNAQWYMLIAFCCVACMWILLVMYLAPGKTLRYIVPAFGLLFLFILAVLYAWRKTLVGFILATIIFGNLGYHYTLDQNMFGPTERYDFAHQHHIPVVVNLPKWSWQYGTLVYYFNDIGKYFIESDHSKSRALLQSLLQIQESVYYIGFTDTISGDLVGFQIQNCQKFRYPASSCLVSMNKK